MRREWRRGKPGEDIPRQYSTLYGHLTPTQPRHEDMRMDSTLNVTPEGSLSDIPDITGENVNLTETQQTLGAPENEIVSTQPSATVLDGMEETPYTSVKVMSMRTPDRQKAGQVDIPRRVQRTREASQGDAFSSARHFFALGYEQNWVVLLGLPKEVQITTTSGITSEISTPSNTSTVPTTSTTTTITGAEMGSPRSFLLNGSPSRPTVTAICRP